MTSLADILMALTLLLSAAALVWAAVSDVRSYQIPNRAPALVAVAFLLMATVMRPAFVLGGLATGTGVLAIGAVLFARRLMGGGDVKLLAAAALWCGPGLLTPFALVTSLSGAALAGVMLSPLARRLPAPPAGGWVVAEPGAGAVRQPAPFGVAIALGGLWVLSRYVVLIR
jgi:prepilin peptidase CpaA